MSEPTEPDNCTHEYEEVDTWVKDETKRKGRVVRCKECGFLQYKFY